MLTLHPRQDNVPDRLAITPPFDAAVRESLKKQAKSKGFEFEEPAK